MALHIFAESSVQFFPTSLTCYSLKGMLKDATASLIQGRLYPYDWQLPWGNQAKEKDNHNYYRQVKNGTYDGNNNYQSQDYRNGGYGRNYGPPPRGPPPQQRIGAVPMEIDMAQGRGRACFKCGQPGHVKRKRKRERVLWPGLRRPESGHPAASGHPRLAPSNY